MPPPKKSGFSLIEAAIIMGVIGLVIGGIWVAASSVMLTRATNEAQQTILTIVSRWRGNYQNISMQALVDAGTPYITGDPALFANIPGVHYQDAYHITYDTNIALGGTFGVVWDGYCGYSPCEVIDVYLTPPSTAMCERLVAFFAANSTNLGIVRMMNPGECPTYSNYISLLFKK